MIYTEHIKKTHEEGVAIVRRRKEEKIMKKIKKIDTVCNRAAALGCVEDIQIEIKKNYDFFYEYLGMFPQRSMVKALRSASLLGKIFVTGMEGDTVPTYQTYVLGVLKALQKYDWDDRAQARLWRAGAEEEWYIAKAYTVSRSAQVVSPDKETINVRLSAGEGYDGDHNDIWLWLTIDYDWEHLYWRFPIGHAGTERALAAYEAACKKAAECKSSALEDELRTLLA